MEKKLLVKRTNEDNLKPVFVNDLVVTYSKDAFFLTFSQIEAPALLSEEEIKNVEEIKAVAISKIVITTEFMETIKNLLAKNYDRFLREVQEGGDNDE